MVVAAGVVWPYEFGRSGFLYIYVSCDFDYSITRTIYGIKPLYFVSCYCMYIASMFPYIIFCISLFTVYRVMCESCVLDLCPE